MKSNSSIIRGVMIAWLIGWYIKGYFYFPYLFHEIAVVPIQNSFFPGVFSAPLAAQFAYALPISIILTICQSEPRFFRWSSGLMIFSSAILCWHKDTYSDATFVASFWVALWLLWVSIRIDRIDAGFRLHAKMLAVFILSIVFMGGLVGKLTPEYWNGHILYHIFIAQNNHWPFFGLKKFFSLEQLQLLCAVMSRFIIGVEMFLSFSLFLPFRLVRFWAPLVMGGMTLFSTWRILSVLSCLIGMIWFCGRWESLSAQERGEGQ